MESLEFIKCYYMPSFFRMKIDLPVKLDNLLDITDATFALYFHEYIHFVQDISTIYGLMNISTITYYIQDCAHKIYTEKNKEFETPISIQDTKNDHGYKNFLLKPIYIGSPINPKHKKVEIINYKKNTYQWGKNSTEVIDIVKIEAKKADTNQEFTFDFGGNHITEGMAYLCEQYIYSQLLHKQGIPPISADEYPYLIATKLAQLIYPDLADEQLFVIAACDVSLMTYHPGLNFIRLLEHLRETQFMNSNPTIEKFYSFSLEFLKGNHADFDKILEQVKDQLTTNFRAELFKGNNDWVIILLDRIKILRMDNPAFITDILHFGDLKRNEIFGIFHNIIGSPLVINGDHEGIISLPAGFNAVDFRPELFWAINQMLRIFIGSAPVPCELKDYCIKSQEVDDTIIVDERCDISPWKRCGDEKLCSFAVMWKHWALCGLSPKSNLTG